jgi:small-conductance mechanosensitive channel
VKPLLKKPSVMARCFLILAVCFAATTAAQAQMSLLKPLTQTTKAPTASSDSEFRQRAEAQFAEALKMQADSRLEEGSASGDVLPASDQQRTLDRLVVAYGERLKLLDQIDTLKKTGVVDFNRQSLIAEFSGAPPYAVARVDLLRDEFDVLRDRLVSLQTQLHALELQKASFLAAQRKFSEAYRLADDRFARADGSPNAEIERRAQKLAELRVKLADCELSNAALNEEAVREEVKLLSANIAEVQQVVTRAISGQALSKEALDKEKSRLNAHLSSITAEIDRIIAANVKRTNEREWLAKAATKSPLSQVEARRLQFLDTQIETDRIYSITLGWLQNLIENASGAWSSRYAGLANPTGPAREEAIEIFRRLHDELESRSQIVEEEQRGARTAIRQQELRLESVLLDVEVTAHEAAILELIKKRAQAYQRVGLAASKFDRELLRWLSDFGAGDQSQPQQATWSDQLSSLKRLAGQVWNFELFAVDEMTMVDGKTVSVSYGVTVGKSVGVLLLFALGYFVFSLFVRWLQRFMVRRFAVDEQFAIVIRRWLMTLLMVGLIVFTLNLARIPLTVFAFMGGALAIGVGFGTQTIIKNFISGIIILFERKIRVGDIVTLNGISGHVTAVDMRASTVRGFDGVEALVPNSAFLENQVVNWTYSNTRVRREVKVGIAYGSSVRHALEIIEGCAEDHGQVLKNPKPEVYFEDFGDSALMLTLLFWVEMVPGFNSRRVDSDLRFAIEKRLAEAGIAIPFPQRDLRLELTKPVRVEIASPGAI